MLKRSEQRVSSIVNQIINVSVNLLGISNLGKDALLRLFQVKSHDFTTSVGDLLHGSS